MNTPNNYIIVECAETVTITNEELVTTLSPEQIVDNIIYDKFPVGLCTPSCPEIYQNTGTIYGDPALVFTNDDEIPEDYEKQLAVVIAYLGHSGYRRVHFDATSFDLNNDDFYSLVSPVADYLVCHEVQEDKGHYMWDMTKEETYSEIKAYLGSNALATGKITIYRYSIYSGAIERTTCLLQDIMNYRDFGW